MAKEACRYREGSVVQKYKTSPSLAMHSSTRLLILCRRRKLIPHLIKDDDGAIYKRRQARPIESIRNGRQLIRFGR